MAAQDIPATRSLGGLDALSAYRAERAASRLRLRESLRANRASLRAGRGGVARPAPEPAAPIAVQAEEHSVFAALLGRAEAPAAPEAEDPALSEEDGVTAEAPTPPAHDAAPEVEPPPMQDGAPAGSPPEDLMAITELGPGMRLRLGQIGIHTLEDLAAADPASLRDGLGAISRMLRVERWIETARSLRCG